MGNNELDGRPGGLSSAAPMEPSVPLSPPKASIPDAWPLGGYAPGNYLGHCVSCYAEFQGDKRALVCLECAAKDIKFQLREARSETREWWIWFRKTGLALDGLIHAASVFWGAGSEQHNLVRDVADAAFKRSPASAIEAGTAETAQTGSVHESAVAKPDARKDPS